jgi:hypothetical protein
MIGKLWVCSELACSQALAKAPKAPSTTQGGTQWKMSHSGCMTSPDAVLDKSDPGDDVAARFDYQHCYAAISAIRLITNEADTAEIICENHEDFLIKKPTGKFIGTQIKTRLLTLAPLKAGDDQVKKALQKFCVLDRKFPGAFEGFDFTTNHFFWMDEESKNNLPWLLNTLRERGGIKNLRANNPLRQFVEDVTGDTGLSAAAVVSTLQKTTVRGHASDLAHIRGIVREALSECPGLKEFPYVAVIEISNEIVELARNASIKTLKGPITDLYAIGTNLGQIVDDQQLAGKRITKADVLAIIDKFKNGDKRYEDLDFRALITRMDVPADLVVAVRKLARGGVETARVTNIEDRVRSFEALFIEWSNKYGAEEATRRYETILAAVQFEAAEAQIDAEKHGEPYGSLMYATLAKRLMVRAKSDPDQFYKCRPEHLMGAAGILTERCKAWWSPPFAVAGDIQ